MTTLAQSPSLTDHDDLISGFYESAGEYSDQREIDLTVVLTCAVYQLAVEILLADVPEELLAGVIVCAAAAARTASGDAAEVSQ